VLKPTSIYFRKFFKQGNHPDYIVPRESPFLWKWGIPGIRTALFYKKFIALTENKIEYDLNEEEELFQKLAESKFSCIYGKPLNESIRNLCKTLENGEIVTLSELRPLIYSRFLREDKAGNICLKNSSILLAGDLYLFTMHVILLLVFTLVFINSPVITLTSSLIYLALTLYFTFATWFIYWSGIKPYFICKKISKKFNQLKTYHENREKLHLIK